MSVHPDLARFETMLLMRRFEETVQRCAEEKRFDGHYHLYIGQEANGVATMAVLRPGDHIATTHRNHGHLLARGADPGAALAEILGRATGLNQGYGGTFHLCAPELGFLSTSGIVGGAISLAVGGGYACKQRHDGSLTAALFGDGALEEGIAFEAMNIAEILKLPVLFLCENNDADAWDEAQGRSARDEHATDDLRKIPGTFGIPATRVWGRRVADVQKAVAAASARCRAGEGPAFVEIVTRRWPGNLTQYPSLATGITDLHMATGEVTAEGPYATWFAQDDPVLIAARALLEAGITDAAGLHAVAAAVQARIDRAAKFALESPMPAPADALRHVFA
jgi:TPP-dependent pyruvate/acetoin dehydrogenase alpha subunit